MYKITNKIILLTLIVLMLLTLASCDGNTAEESYIIERDNPFVVAETAFKYLTENNIDEFMKLSAYYEGSNLYKDFVDHAQLCIDEVDRMDVLMLDTYDEARYLDEEIEAIEKDGYGTLEEAICFNFSSDETDQWVEIFVGRIDQTWYVWYLTWYY